MFFVRSAVAIAAAAFCLPVLADTAAPVLDPVQVTATRLPESVNVVPATVSIVRGEELRARGANNLRTALSLVAGVEGTPTGDSGPAGSVPAMWGLREADAFLLVVDGVPWGGAFNPSTPSIDLVDVERIEVLRGAAPVIFGATSFNGVIHIIHYAAGTSPSVVTVGGGSYGTYFASGAMSLPSVGSYKQSVSGTIEKHGTSVDREEYERYHLLYRGGTELAIGRFHVDGDVSLLPQNPGNLIFRNGARLRTDILSADANYNPADGKIDQQRFHLAAGLDSDTTFGTLTTTVAVTRTLDDIVRGFLRNYAPDTGVTSGDADKPDDFDADGYAQKRQITDVYFDTHLVTALSNEAYLTTGVDYLFGKGKQNANNFGYYVGLDGKGAPSSKTQHVDEIVSSSDRRNFGGIYTQLDWKVLPGVDVQAGLRVNHTQESASGEEIANDEDQMESQGIGHESKSKTRVSGVIGSSWNFYRDGANAMTVYGDYRNTYKPKAVDFGPEAEVDIQSAETANSYELGVKGALLNGAFTYDFSTFQLDFKNLLTYNDAGDPIDGGKERFRGFEYEGRYTLSKDLQLAGSYSYHNARFKSLKIDPDTDVSGNRLELSPYNLASAGVIYAPKLGFNGSVVSSYAGERKLNKRNTAHAGGYTTWDASLGYEFANKVGLHLNGYNLTDRRVPVAESELAETVSGASSYYLLPARTVVGSVSYQF